MERYPDSLKDWDRALELAAPPYRDSLRAGRAKTLARQGEHAQAAAAAKEMAGRTSVTGEQLYLAISMSKTSAAAAIDSKKAEEYATSEYVELLRKAAKAGYFKEARNRERLKKDRDFDPLRTTQSFKKLVADLEER